jgi:hypothetical protein
MGSAYQNPADSADVNGDGVVSALDALLIFNDLNARGSRSLAPAAEGEGESLIAENPWAFLDVSGDAHVSAIDALMVFNRLNSQQQQADELMAEGESMAAPAASSDPAESMTANEESTDALLALLADDVYANGRRRS